MPGQIVLAILLMHRGVPEHWRSDCRYGLTWRRRACSCLPLINGIAWANAAVTLRHHAAALHKIPILQAPGGKARAGSSVDAFVGTTERNLGGGWCQGSPLPEQAVAPSGTITHSDTISLSVLAASLRQLTPSTPCVKRGRELGRAGADCLAETHDCYASSASVLALVGY